MEYQHYNNPVKEVSVNGTKLNIMRCKSGSIYNVEKNDDGTLHIQRLTVHPRSERIDIDENFNAGQLINNKGGIEKVLEQCQPMTDNQLMEFIQKEWQEKKTRREYAAKYQAERDKVEREKATKEFANIAGQNVEVSWNNLRIFLRYLLYSDGIGYRRGSVHFTFKGQHIGYFYSNYQCGNVLASAIKFDKPVTIQTAMGPKTDHRFCYHAPMHYMDNYTHITDSTWRL